MTAFEVTKDSPAAMGIVRANPHLGDGKLPQIVIEDYQSVLKPLYSVILK